MNYIKFNEEGKAITPNTINKIVSKYYITPSRFSEIPKSLIENIASDITLSEYYSLIGIMVTTNCSAFTNAKKALVKVYPFFIKGEIGKNDAPNFISNIKMGASIIIAPSDVEMGYNVKSKSNILNNGSIIEAIKADKSFYGTTQEVTSISLKIVPNSAIKGVNNNCEKLSDAYCLLGFVDANGNAIPEEEKGIKYYLSLKQDCVVPYMFNKNALLKKIMDNMSPMLTENKVINTIYSHIYNDNPDAPTYGYLYKQLAQIMELMNKVGFIHHLQYKKLYDLINDESNYEEPAIVRGDDKKPVTFDRTGNYCKTDFSKDAMAK